MRSKAFHEMKEGPERKPRNTRRSSPGLCRQAWQDPATGYWGPSYWSDGHLYKSADLSYTFHIISYRRGNVDHWPEIVETTMAIENEPYPFGWKHEGSYVNHNNYDVAKIFRYGWPHMSPEQKRRAASKNQRYAELDPELVPAARRFIPNSPGILQLSGCGVLFRCIISPDDWLLG